MGGMKDLLGGDLFDQRRPHYPDRPGFKEATTSRDAAEAVTPSANERRAMVLAEIKKSTGGMTADEVAQRLDLSVLAIRPRVSELKASAKIVATGERRPNASGLKAKVWRAVA